MADLDLAKLREQIAQALLDRFIARGLARARSTFEPGTKVSTLPASYKDDFLADADAIISLLRQALQAAWEAGRDAAAKYHDEEAEYFFKLMLGNIRGGNRAKEEACDRRNQEHKHDASMIRALTPPNHLTEGK